MDRFDIAMRERFAEVQRQREDMHTYQSEIAVPFLRDNPFSGLFCDMGLGKSISSLTVISDLLAEFTSDDPVLVIAPLRVATDTWPTEIAAWQHTAWMNHVVIRDDGRFVRKEDLARSRAAIHIINREQVDWLVHFHREQWPYRIVFVDESSSFKDHTSNRFKALAKVRRTPGLIERLHILTATPAAESYIGLFTQIYLLDLGHRLGKNITAYRDQYFSYNKYSMKYTLRPGAEEEILEKIADITLVMKKKDYLPTAEPTVIQHKVKLAPAQIDLLKKLERDFLVTLPDGTELEAKTAAILSSMLLQMASGCVYETLLIEDWETDDLKKVKKVHDLHDHKVEALKEIAEEAANEGKPLLVAYYFQSSLAKLRKAFPKAVVMDKSGKCIKAWNAGKIPMLLIHPQSAGHGLNLQYGGSTLVFFDLIYSLEFYLQTIGRLDRQGQLNPVLVILLVAMGSRDELVAECLAAKEDAQDKFFAILKRLIKALRAKRAEAL
jgi:hypothetical protein